MKPITHLRRALAFLMFIVVASCQNDYQEFCTLYPVSFSCDITNAPYNVVTSMGQFLTVKQKSGKRNSVTVFNASTQKSTEVALSEVEARTILLGLGGLILGLPYFGDGSVCYAYDLACPVCDVASAILKVTDDGHATCPKCNNVYDLNNGGIVTAGSGRPLYRYHVNHSTAATIYVHN